jgi:hypothetical protein
MNTTRIEAQAGTEAATAAQTKDQAGPSARLAAFITSLSPRTLTFGVTAAMLGITLQAAVIAVQAGLFTGLFQGQVAGPKLASYSDNEPEQTGSFVLIRFNPKAGVGDITKFLQVNKSTIVDGPAAGSGMYRLRVAGTQLSNAELGTLAKTLSKDPVVGFAAPAAQH